MSTALALVRDLFFRSKLDGAAAAAGASVAYASDLATAAVRCSELKPAVVFVDLSDDVFPAAATVRAIRGAAPTARLIGFASHVDLKSLAGAREVGFDRTLSRSEFSAQLGVLLKG
jgi:DNA-binding NarL/FixJ family response regulator